MQTAFTLERAQGGFGGRRELTALVAEVGQEAGGTEAPLEIADGLAALATCQWEVGRNSPSSSSSCPLPLAPTRRLDTSPLSNTSSVGMLIT